MTRAASSEAGYLPVDTQAERALLAAVLTSPDAASEALEQLRADDFGVRTHREIFSAVVDADSAGKAVDYITVTDQLRRRKALSKAGGAEQVAALAAEGSEAYAAASYIQIIVDKSLRRSVVEAGRAMSQTAMAPEGDGEAVLETAEQAVFEIGRGRESSSLVTMTQAVASTMRQLANVRHDLLLGLSTGFPTLDRLTAGLQGGQLIIVAARPGIGKSSFAVQIAAHIAATSGKIVPFLSYEMSTEEIVTKLLSQRLRFSGQKLRQGDVPPGLERDLAVVAEQVAALPLLLDDSPPVTVAGVRSAMRRLSRRGEVGAVFVDYLQLLEGDRRSRDPNRTQEVTEISRGLKRLATELDVPVVALSQLNRNVEARTNKRPLLADLRESGSLEQDANCVLMLYRPSHYYELADPGELEVILAKQRSGPAGLTVKMHWQPDCTLVTDPGRKPERTEYGSGGGGAF